jgi:hypothetical protein
MAILTPADRALFTAAQLVEVDKFPASRLDKDKDFVGGQAAYKAMILAKWQRMSSEKLRAKVCFGSASQGVITWSAECDLTADEKAAVQDLMALGGKPVDIIIAVMAGKRSVEQRLAALGG